jgi:hypothetical protein
METRALLPLATRWPQKTVGTQACPNEGITDPVVAGWLQPLAGSRLRQLRFPHWVGEEDRGRADVQSGLVVVPTPMGAHPAHPSFAESLRQTLCRSQTGPDPAARHSRPALTYGPLP